MSRQDEMRELVKRLSGNHASRHEALAILRSNVQQQRSDAGAAVLEMSAARAQASSALHAGLADDLAGLRDTVQATLVEFEAARQQMKADLQADLNAASLERQQTVTTLRTGARQFVGEVAESRQARAADLFTWLADNHIELHDGVRDLLDLFANKHASMREAMHQVLAAEAEARRQDVTNMVAAIEAMLDRFAAENQAAVAGLHQFLQTNAAERGQALATLLGNIRALLEQVAAENRTAAAELRAFLAADGRARDAAVAAFRADAIVQRHIMAKDLAERLDRFTADLAGDVHAKLADFGAERSELHASLAEMAGIWRAYANGLSDTVVEPQPEATAKEPGPPAMSPEPEAAPALVEAKTTARILSFLAGKPDGAKLVELEPELGLSRLQLGRHLRSLMETGKITKDPETKVYKLA